MSKITDEVIEWQKRPSGAVVSDPVSGRGVVKVRDGEEVQNRAAHIAMGVDMEGIKHVLGIRVEATDCAKFWAGVCAELANRGVKDVLVVCAPTSSAAHMMARTRRKSSAASRGPPSERSTAS